MISMKDAAKIVKDKFPNNYPVRVMDFDKNNYLIEAPRSQNEMDMQDPFFIVSKDGKNVGSYNPAGDPKKLIAATKTAVNISDFK